MVLLDDLSSHENDLQLHCIVHGVVHLEQLALDYGAERRRLRVVKMRGSSAAAIMTSPSRRAASRFSAPRRGRAPQTLHRRIMLSGIAELDALLGGGLERGTSALLIGGAGVGKSSMALAYAVLPRARREHATSPSTRGWEHPLRAAGTRHPAAEHVDSGRIRRAPDRSGELSPGEFATIVRSVEGDGARVVVIDSLNGYLNAMPEERFLVLQMHELLSYLNQLGVVTILVLAQHGVIGPMETPVDISYLSDAVLMLRYFEAAGHVRRALSVVKKRSGPHEDTIREFRLSAQGLQVGPPLTEFSGIFAGIPTYSGGDKPLMHGDENDRGALIQRDERIRARPIRARRTFGRVAFAPGRHRCDHLFRRRGSAPELENRALALPSSRRRVRSIGR